MPANLTPQYLAAEQKYKQARTPEDKIAALKEMYAYLPKHKGTEKLQGEIKRRLARLRQEQQKGRSRKGHSFYIDREGAGQVVLVGPPNSGKSALLNALTKATTEVADYPFTTHKPHPGMMPYKDIQIQLIDLPPVSARHLDFWVPELIKHGDLVLLVLDLGQAEVLDELEETLNLLRQHKIHVFWRTPG
ncbi:MAG: GTP-binding protein HSR1, partial [Calditrichaeota bacterium]